MTEKKDAFDDHTILGIAKWRWEIVNQVVSLFGVVGLLFGVYQYSQSLEAARAEKTLDLIDRWTDDGYHENYRFISGLIKKGLSELSDTDLKNVNDGNVDKERVYTRITEYVLQDYVAQQNFEKIIYFFNRLGLCVKANLCSANTAKIFFDDTVTTFLAYFRNEIEDRRKLVPGYAAGTLHLFRLFE